MEKRIASGISIILHPFFIPSFVMLALLNLNVFMAFVIPAEYSTMDSGNDICPDLCHAFCDDLFPA